MDFIQTNVSEAALVTAIRANLCSFYRYLSRSFPEGFFENDRFIRWHAPIAHPWFNGVLSSKTPDESDKAFIEESIHYFRRWNVSTMTWWMEPHLKCTDWEPVLSSYGFGFSNDTPGMAIDLQELKESSQVMDELEVREVRDEETLRNWSHVFTSGYGLPADWEPSVHKLSRGLGLDSPVRNFLGILDGEPVATSALFCGGGVAGIYDVATLHEARGRGIAAAVTLRPLQIAREMGYRIGVLQSSEMGFNVYKKLGFRHLCQIEYFYRALA